MAIFFTVMRDKISIHTLRMEGDYYNYLCDVLDNISIHTLRMEGDGHYF